MNFEIKPLTIVGAASEKCDVLIVLVPNSFIAGKDDLSDLIAQAVKSGDFETKAGKLLSLYQPVQANAVRVILAGAGDGTPKDVRAAIVGAIALAKSKSLKKLLLCFGMPAREDAVRAAVVAVSDATYVYTLTKSQPEPRTLLKVLITTTNASEVKTSFDRAVGTVIGIELARDWANRPANHSTPTMLGLAAKELANFPKLTCEVLGPKEVVKLGMGSFMAVAQGSDQPLQFVVLRYDGTLKAKPPVVLVGKGITFDSGGISIKPAAEMDEMKFDMAGAASVLGVFRALAHIKPAINVVGLIPACENLINGRALKPGDVITSLSGQTIEVLNTDAEGRLVLCDALTYAERFKPLAVIDIATLTGACVVALGGVRSGLFSPQDDLANALLAAGESTQDFCWRMPLDDDYAEGLKTGFADVANVGGRAGGAVSAAKFLQRFAGKFPWAHLDIAGTAWKGGAAKGATGRPVALLVEYLLEQAIKK
jgi:leucyl aminopeptidase